MQSPNATPRQRGRTDISRRHHIDRRARSLAEQPGDPDDLLSSRDLASWFGVSLLWVELGRIRDYGPPFLRIGPKMVRYRRGDVLRWLEGRANAANMSCAR